MKTIKNIIITQGFLLSLSGEKELSDGGSVKKPFVLILFLLSQQYKHYRSNV